MYSRSLFYRCWASAAQLYRAESAGPQRSEINAAHHQHSQSAVRYLLFAHNGVLGKLCGRWHAPFDALCHAFSTVAIGGFSTHDASLGHYEQNSVLLVSSVFMVLSAINFGLHFLALQRRNIRVYSHDSETAFFIR